MQLKYFANQFQEIIGLMIENNVTITLRKELRKFSILLIYLNHLSHIWFDAFVPLIYMLAYNSVLLWKIFKKNFSPNSDLIFLPVKCHSENWATKPFLSFITMNTIIQIARLSPTEILEKRRFLHDSSMAALSKSDWNSKCLNPPVVLEELFKEFWKIPWKKHATVLIFSCRQHVLVIPGIKLHSYLYREYWK